MALKKLKPVTPGTRHRLAPSFDDITASKPEKSLVVTIKKTGGRNSGGRMTMRRLRPGKPGWGAVSARDHSPAQTAPRRAEPARCVLGGSYLPVIRTTAVIHRQRPTKTGRVGN